MSANTKQVVVPDIGDADDVEVIELTVGVGDAVDIDDALIVIESDKASMEIPSPFAGVVHAISVALGDQVSTGQVVAEIAVSESESPAAPESTAVEKEAVDKASAEKTAAEKAVVEEQSPAGAVDVEAQRLEVRLPDVGDAGEVVVIEVDAQPGATVAADQMLLVVESDKASMDIVAPAAGQILEVVVGEGDAVTEGSLLVVLSAAGAAVAVPEVAPAADVKAPAAETKPPAKPAPKPAKQMPAGGLAEAGTVYAGPAVRRLARELGVDLSKVVGTGARARITKDDVSEYVKSRLTDTGSSSGSGIPAVAEIDFSKFGEIELQPLSRIMRRGASNLHRSWLNVVHVTQHDEADITDLEAFRQSLKSEAKAREVKITPLPFLLKACAYMLQQHPLFNASLDAELENYIVKKYVNIGFAVDTPDGLLVPVVRDVDKKGVWDLAADIDALVEKAKTKKLTPQDLQGGNFSISSLGAIGGTGFTPIVNAPEVAILGVSRLATKPQWNGSEFVPRKMLPLSLSYDHRAINGAAAGRFCTDLCELLADIRRLAL